MKRIKRKYTKRNEKYWAKEEEYSAYFKAFTDIQRTMRKSGKKHWTQGHGKYGPGQSPTVDLNVRTFDKAIAGEVKMLNKAQFRRKMAASGGSISGIEVAEDQFRLLSTDLAATIQSNLRKAGIKKADGTEYSIIEIRTRQLPQEAWDAMEAKAKNSGTNVNQYFFGS